MLLTLNRSVRSNIPPQRVNSGFSTSNTCFIHLRKYPTGALLLAPKSPWIVAIWPAAIGLLAFLVEPVRRLFWTLFFDGGATFDDPFFSGFIRGMFLWMGFAAAGLIYIFYRIVQKWTPTTRFDQGQNLILRQAIDSNFFGVRSRIEEVRMKISEARAIQLCHGGFEEGDSESPGYDYWQLLIVGPGDPPFRAILAQDAERKKLTSIGREIAAYLALPWIDDGDYRSPVTAEHEKTFQPGRLESDGTFVTTGSTNDPLVDPDVILQDYKNRKRPRDRIFFLIFFGLFVGILLFVWRVSIQENAQPDATNQQSAWRASGPTITVPLSELLANGSKYHGKKIKTTGYARFVTMILRPHDDDNALTLYALSPEPIDLSQREKGGTIGQTAVTNLMIHTRQWLNGFSGSETNITPQRTIIGAFHFNGPYHNLSLLAWTPESNPQDQ